MAEEAFLLPLAPASAEWGPGAIDADKIFDLPYQPFWKSERLGKITEWSQKPGGRGPYGPSRAADEEEVAEFQTVDPKQRQASRKTQTWGTRGPGRGGRGVMQPGRGGPGRGWSDRPGGRGGRDIRGGRRDARRPVTREPSHEFALSYPRRLTWLFNDLSKQVAREVPKGEVIKTLGSVNMFDHTLVERLTVGKPLDAQAPTRYTIYDPETTRDPVIQELTQEFVDANSDEKLPEGKPLPTCFFMPEMALAMIMCATRSVLSWDLLLNIVVDCGVRVVFVSIRPKQTELLFPVNESNPAVFPSDIKDIRRDALEAYHVNSCFQLGILKEGVKGRRYGENPFYCKEDKPAFPIAYKYRRWQLNPTTTIVARCQVDGVTRDLGSGMMKKPNEAPVEYRAFALNEIASSETKWRTQLATNKSGVLQMTEFKHNTAKVQRWAACALLSQVDRVYLGLASRTSENDASRHTLLHVDGTAPMAFAQAASVTYPGLWGQATDILERIAQLEEGDYILMKDPAAPALHLYKVPDDAKPDMDGQDSSGDYSDH